MIYYLTATGNGNSPDGTLPPGAVACTQAQYENATAWTISGSAIVAAAPVALSPAAAYAAFIAAGLTVTSTSTAALNGVYPIDADSQADISAEAQFISAFSEFTTGTATNLPWQLQSGAPVTFPTTAEFMAFAKVAAQTVAAAKLAKAQGAAMPSPAISIS